MAVWPLVFIGIVIGTVGFESATAGTLQNSVRVGDRSRMHIAPVPTPGSRTILPGPERRVLGPDRGAPGKDGKDKGRIPIPAAGPQDWFWALHRVEAEAGAPTRWGAARDSLRTRRSAGKGIVSTALMRRVVERHGPRIAAAAERHTISPALIAAVIAVESAGQVRAVSHAGAMGLMQLMPATARRFGVSDRGDPDQNIRGGTAYLSWLLSRFGHDPILALAGYNAGEGAVDRFEGVPPYRETRDYVVKVFDALVAAEALCARPPATPRHPCDWTATIRTASDG